MDEVNFLLNLVSRDKLNTMSGKQKKAYKYTICALFINIIQGNHFTYLQNTNKKYVITVQKLPHKDPDLDGILNLFSLNVNTSLENNNFKKPYDDKFLNNVIAFLRTRLKEMDNDGISLFQVKDISRILDINQFCGISCLAEHHWVEFSLNRHIIPTFPEYILFNDLKVQWNYYIDVKAKLSNSQINIKTKQEYFEYLKNEQNRHDSYSLGALHRTLIISCVSFVEAYLYDLFLLITKSNLPNKKEIESILNKRKIQDIEIVERVLCYLFSEIKTNDEFNDLYKKYKKVIKIRDRYIHASAFTNTSSNKSDLEPLLNLDENSLVEALQLSVDFVNKINELLPKEFKILYWMDSNENDAGYNKAVNFHEFTKLSLTNSKSNFNQRDYDNP